MPRPPLRLRLLILLGSSLLVSCAPRGAAREVALQPLPATAVPPSPTRTRPTPTARPSATPLPPTAEPTRVPPTPNPDAAPFDVAPVGSPAPAPQGWVAYDKSPAGFSFAMPPEWRVSDLDREDAEALLDQHFAQEPELEQLFGSSLQSMLAQGLKVIACDCSAAAVRGGFPSTMNVLVHHLPTEVSMDLVVQQTIMGLDAMPTTVDPINHVRIDHPSGSAEAIQYRMRVGVDDVVVTATQYLLMQEQRLVLVSIVAPVDVAEANTPTYYKIIQTFRLTAEAGQQM
jgi:hypothetical protein